jgi:hypothetical protein
VARVAEGELQTAFPEAGIFGAAFVEKKHFATFRVENHAQRLLQAA